MVVCERIAIEVNVTIPSAAFQDEAGNDVVASSIFHWSYDGKPPTLSISALGAPTKISYLVVGGGGGGSSGGGGGGGVIEELDFHLIVRTILKSRLPWEAVASMVVLFT